MFHKATTEAERQKIFDDYILRLLKDKQVIKKNKKIRILIGMLFQPAKNQPSEFLLAPRKINVSEPTKLP